MDDCGESRLREYVNELKLENAKLLGKLDPLEGLLFHIVPLLDQWATEEETNCSAPFIAREFLDMYGEILKGYRGGEIKEKVGSTLDKLQG